MFPSPKFLSSLLISAGLLVSCSLPGRRGRAATPSPAATDSLVPSATVDNTDYLRTLREIGFGKYLDAGDGGRTKTVESGWDIYHYYLADCRCILGDEYQLASRKGSESAKTVLWLEGGGACFPGRDECTKEATFNLRKLQSGLASSSPDNPVKDWNFIYAPYCDGSIHLGDSDSDYDVNGEIDHWFWGLKNTSAAVRLMEELFPQSQEILIAGCSAGGYGTLGTTPMIRLQFPGADLYVLNESGLGLMNPAILPTYRTAYQIWNLTHLFPLDCPQCGDQYIYMYPWMLARDPRLRVGVFSSYRDATFSANWEMAPEDFETLLLEKTESARKEYPDLFKRFFIKGGGHCVQNYSYAVNGVLIWDWIGYLVANDPRWADILE